MKTLKLKFVDFWPDLTNENNFFYNILKKHYNVEVSDDPDLLFYSNYGFEHLKYKCKKIFYTGENIKPNFNFCDYAFSFEETSEKNFHFPHLIEFEYFFDFKDRKIDKNIEYYRNAPKIKFCNFIASNKKAKERIKFTKKLMEYRHVDCYGPVLNNITTPKKPGKLQRGHYINWRREKLELIKNYKFTIAFENKRAKNYVTEKIYQALLVGSVPIYWGAPNISEYFNTNCFLDVSKFESFEEAIEEIIKIDNEPKRYQNFFKEWPIKEGSKLSTISEDLIHEKIREVLESSSPPVGKVHARRNAILYCLVAMPLYSIKIFRMISKCIT